MLELAIGAVAAAAAWIGIDNWRWLRVLPGVRRSHNLRVESLDAALIRPSVWGLHCAA